MTLTGLIPESAASGPIPKPWRMPEDVRDGFRALKAEGSKFTQGKAIGVTSILPGEGVTWVCSRLACAFAEANEPTAVFELGGSSMFREFGLASPASEGRVKRSVVNEHLTIGSINVPSMASICSEIAAAQRPGRSLILDCEPLSGSAQVLELNEWIGGVFVVVEAGRTRREVLAAGLEKLKRAGVPLIGTVLNKRRRYLPGYIYETL